MSFLLPALLLALILLMVFQLSKQRKTMKSVQELQAGLAPGDRVLTTSGVHGTVVSAEGPTVMLEIAPGVRTEWDRRVVREKVLPEVAGTSDPDPT